MKAERAKMTTMSLAEMCLKHRKAGIKEAVEWMDRVFPDWRRNAQSRMSKEAWQYRMKEWGIE